MLLTYHQQARLLDAGTPEQAERSAARAWLGSLVHPRAAHRRRARRRAGPEWRATRATFRAARSSAAGTSVAICDVASPNTRRGSGSP
jgi:hypothetical protein